MTPMFKGSEGDRQASRSDLQGLQTQRLVLTGADLTKRQARERSRATQFGSVRSGATTFVGIVRCSIPLVSKLRSEESLPRSPLGIMRFQIPLVSKMRSLGGIESSGRLVTSKSG